MWCISFVGVYGPSLHKGLMSRRREKNEEQGRRRLGSSGEEVQEAG